MRRALLGAAGAFGIAVVAFSGNAQAQCWRDGFGSYNCATPPVTYYQPYYERYYPRPAYWGTPYAAWNAYDYRNYRLDPMWLPSYPGPAAGGH